MGTSLVLTGRTPVDHVASLVTGRDCSAVHIERREPWCRPTVAEVPPQAFCTRSLGAVDCWTAAPSGSTRQAADPPAPVPVPPSAAEAGWPEMLRGGAAAGLWTPLLPAAAMAPPAAAPAAGMAPPATAPAAPPPPGSTPLP